NRADVRHLPLQTEPVLPARRDRRAARRRQRASLCRDAEGHARPHPVHSHHAQPADDGDRKSPVRRDNGRTGRLEADLCSIELSDNQRRGANALQHPNVLTTMMSLLAGIAALLGTSCLLIACDVKVGKEGVSVDVAHGKATDDWMRTYSLKPGGRL